MTINRRDFLKTGIITALLIPNVVYGIEKIVNQKQEIQKQEPKQISTSKLIKKIKLEESVDFVQECRKNRPFKQQIKQYGFDKTAQHLAKLKSYSVDLAQKYVQDTNEIPEKEYLLISKQIGLDQIKFQKGHTKPLAKNVIKARAQTIKIATENSIKIISRANRFYNDQNIQSQYFKLIKENFTEKEYTAYCNNLADAMDDYYNALGKTLGWKIIIGGKDIKKLKQTSRKHYFAKRDKIYSKNN